MKIELTLALCECCASRAKYRDENGKLFCCQEHADFYYHGSLHCPTCEANDENIESLIDNEDDFNCKICGTTFCEKIVKIDGVRWQRGTHIDFFI